MQKLRCDAIVALKDAISILDQNSPFEAEIAGLNQNSEFRKLHRHALDEMGKTVALLEDNSICTPEAFIAYKSAMRAHKHLLTLLAKMLESSGE